MANLTEQYEDKGSFAVDGKEWKALIQADGKGEYRKAFATVAAADRSAVFQLQPTLLQENGDVESFKIKKIDPAGKSDFVLPSDIPEGALNKLVELTNEAKLQGNAGYYTDSSGRDTKSINFSHTIETEGKEWKVAQFTEKGVSTPIPAVAHHGAFGTELHALLPTEINDEGKISAKKLVSFRGGEWKDAAQDAIPARVVEELERFGNKFKHFGEQGKVLQERIDSKANAIIAETDLDADLAKLLKTHHEKALDDALDNRDFPKAKEAAEEASAHREAAEKLGKPKGHLERLKFEREQQLKVAENGDIERFSR